MPDLRNCEKCGKVFNSEGLETLCNDCNITGAKDLKKVIDYLRKKTSPAYWM
jgi:predicted  nucleic acid-binding Zn-ribbon protein